MTLEDNTPIAKDKKVLAYGEKTGHLGNRKCDKWEYSGL